MLQRASCNLARAQIADPTPRTKKNSAASLYALLVMVAARPTTKLSHPGQKHVSRECGTESANPGWRQRLVETGQLDLNGLKVIFRYCVSHRFDTKGRDGIAVWCAQRFSDSRYAWHLDLKFSWHPRQV